MKRALIGMFVCLLIFTFQISFSQVLNTQGVLRDGTGHSVADGTYQITFRIWDAETGGTKVYEQVSSVAVTNGIYNVELGNVSNPLNMLNSSASYWLGVEVASDGEMAPRHKLNVSPYEFAKLKGDKNVFLENGNVGIGTLSPMFKLHVHGTTALSKIASTGDEDAIRIGVDGEYSGSVKFFDDDNENAESFKMTFNASSEDLNFSSDNTADILHLDHLGNVGIGTASPTAQLSLGASNSGSAGTTDGVQLRLSGTHNNGVNIGGTKLMIEGYDNDGAEVYPIYVRDENAAADFWIKNKPSGTGLSTAYFQGNVGVGTSSPTKQLTINSAVNTAALSIGGYLSNEHWTGIQMGYGADDADTYHKVGIFYKRVGGYALGSLIFATDNTSDDSNVDIDDARMTITSAGNVGIGTTSPGKPLHVIGGSAVNNANSYGLRIEVPAGHSAAGFYWDFGIDNESGDEDLIFHSKNGCEAYFDDDDGAFGHSSDMRLKKNIEPMGNVLDKVMQLKPSTYHMKSEADTDQKKIGFIAQDVQKVFPKLNTVSEHNGVLGLYYEDFSVLAIAAIQDQQKIIESQQGEIKNQQSQINDLKSRLEKLETLLKKN